MRASLLSLPTIITSGGTVNTTVGERFLVDASITGDTFVYSTRQYSVASDDNPSKQYTLNSLITGRESETNVKAALLLCGLDVKSPEFTSDEAGAPDLVVSGCHIVEVKSYSYDFTTPASFPYDGVFTDDAHQTVAKFNHAKRLGGSLFYVIVSRVTGAMVGFRYNSLFFTTNRYGKTVGEREHLLTIKQLTRYLRR
jgi:hypothetical protein